MLCYMVINPRDCLQINTVALADHADFYRIDASEKLDTTRRALLGQYMTPTPIGRFMASLFVNTRGDLRVLDPGAGVGSLTAAFAERLCTAELFGRDHQLGARQRRSYTNPYTLFMT